MRTKILSIVDVVHSNVVFQRRLRVLAEAIAEVIPDDASILDIGCGSGHLGERIARLRSAKIEGIEVKPRSNCRLPYRGFDGQRLPYPDASFDVCLLVDVLHHAASLRQLLNESARVARRCVVIKDHIYESRIDFGILRFMDWVGNAPHGISLPYNYQNYDQWMRHFSACGLNVENWKEKLPLYPFPFSLIFSRRLHVVALLTKGVGRLSRSSTIHGKTA